MIKKILSIIESVIAGILTWKVFVPFFFELSKTEIGNWAYFGLLIFLIIVFGLEYHSYNEDKLTWIFSLFLGEKLN